MPTFDETITIKPEDNTPAIVIEQASESHYPHIEFRTPEGKFMASVVVHQKAHDGTTHNHLSIYVADPSAKNGRRSKVDLQFGKVVSTLSLEGITLLLKDTLSRLVMRCRDGDYHQISADSHGIFVKELPKEEKRDILKAGVFNNDTK